VHNKIARILHFCGFAGVLGGKNHLIFVKNTKIKP
jgi:hypothetical protein